MTKVKKKVVSVLLTLTVMFGGIGAAAYSYNYLHSYMTGVPGSGKVNAVMTRTDRRFYTKAIGRNTDVQYRAAYREAHAVANRAFSGNQTWWGYY